MPREGTPSSSTQRVPTHVVIQRRVAGEVERDGARVVRADLRVVVAREGVVDARRDARVREAPAAIMWVVLVVQVPDGRANAQNFTRPGAAHFLPSHAVGALRIGQVAGRRLAEHLNGGAALVTHVVARRPAHVLRVAADVEVIRVIIRVLQKKYGTVGVMARETTDTLAEKKACSIGASDVE